MVTTKYRVAPVQFVQKIGMNGYYFDNWNED